ncbi:MAG TPA: hypothetical protein VKQ72_22595 [Aggregatilineales bacterium]|nr:hypothetical protein [Aggregatilineales bacterium]
MDSGDLKNPNLEDLMNLGKNTAKAGNKENARVIFRKVLDTDKRNVEAWQWMASLADNNVDKRRYLETVLKLNPGNQWAQKQLAAMNNVVATGESASLRFGIMILVVLVVALVVVGVVVFLLTHH